MSWSNNSTNSKETVKKSSFRQTELRTWTLRAETHWRPPATDDGGLPRRWGRRVPWRTSLGRLSHPQWSGLQCAVWHFGHLYETPPSATWSWIWPRSSCRSLRGPDLQSRPRTSLRWNNLHLSQFNIWSQFFGVWSRTQALRSALTSLVVRVPPSSLLSLWRNCQSGEETNYLHRVLSHRFAYHLKRWCADLNKFWNWLCVNITDDK